jgi:hypothetical protein
MVWVGLSPSPALAQTARNVAESAPSEPQSWRSPRPPESKQFAAIELRLGPYIPKIDDPFPSSKPYESVFGTDHRILFGLEVDWQALRIPHLGTLGPGLGWSYTHMTANAMVTGSDPPVASAEETNLSIMPMYGVAVLRVDELVRSAGIPLVGYGKAGIGYGLWWTGNDLETVRRGHTWGTQFAVGAMFMLDVLDDRAAFEIDNEWGVNNTYLFFEYMMSNLNDFKSSNDTSVMRIGSNTWMAGLALEL